MASNSESDYRLLPKFINSKRAVLNPKNNDHRSFGYAIMFALYPKDWKLYKFKPEEDQNFNHLCLQKIKYPVLIDEIPDYEEQLNIRINVFSFEDSAGFKRHSVYISKKFKPEEVNMLYWEGRYALIKYISRLFSDVRKYYIFNILYKFHVLLIVYDKLCVASTLKLTFARAVLLISITSASSSCTLECV